MKKKIFMLFLILTFSTGVLAACNKSSDSSNKTLKIGASISPHTEILEHIKPKDGLEDYSATPSDIIYNPKNLKIIEVDAAVLPRSLDSLAAAVINTNYVISAGIDTNSAIVIENSDSPYANIVAVRSGDEDREDIKILIDKLKSEDVKEFIKDKYGKAVIPAF